MGLVRNLVLVLACLSLSIGLNRVGAQVHHVVGGDRGWDLASGIVSWSAGRIFNVGDTLWFTYSAGHESIAELKSKEEFESCDVTNPIKMYTNGLDSIPLEGDEIRYFVSGDSENCKKGMKLHVNVHPPQSDRHEIQTVATSEGEALADADSPSSPSAVSPSSPSAVSPSPPSAVSPSPPSADSPPSPPADNPPSPCGSSHLVVLTSTSVLLASFIYHFMGIM